MTNVDAIVLKFWVRVSAEFHFVKAKTSRKRIAKKRNRINQKHSRLKMMGKLALQRKSVMVVDKYDLDVHGGLEQLV
jgi:hypothetical protein